MKMYPKLPTGYMAKSTAIIISGGTFLYGSFEYFKGNEEFHRNQLMPMMHSLLGSDYTIRLNVLLAKYRLLPVSGDSYREYPELGCNVLGLNFKNPLGLSGEFDQHGEAINGLRKSGFGFIEVGHSLSKNKAAESRIVKRLKPLFVNIKSDDRIVDQVSDHKSVVPLGINLNTKQSNETSIVCGISDVYFASTDYFVLNIDDEQMSKSDGRSKFDRLLLSLESIKKTTGETDQRYLRKPKVLLKIPNTLSKTNLQIIANLALDKKFGIDGIMISESQYANKTSSSIDPLITELDQGNKQSQLDTASIGIMYKLTYGKLPIISCGQISTGSNAYERIKAGACLVQSNCSFLAQGFPIIGRVKRELVKLLHADGFESVNEAVGADHKTRR